MFLVTNAYTRTCDRTCTSSMYTSVYSQMEKEFNCSRIVATLGLSTFIMGLGMGPMLLGPLSLVYPRCKQRLILTFIASFMDADRSTSSRSSFSLSGLSRPPWRKISKRCSWLGSWMACLEARSCLSREEQLVTCSTVNSCSFR